MLRPFICLVDWRQILRSRCRAENDPGHSKCVLSKSHEPSLAETLQQCAREIGLDPQFFSDDLINPAIEQELQHEIQLVRAMEAYSYPSLRLVQNDTVFPISVDYRNHRTTAIIALCWMRSMIISGSDEKQLHSSMLHRNQARILISHS